MNVTKFANYLLAILIILLLANHTVLMYLLKIHGNYGYMIGLITMLVLDVVIIYSMTRIRVEDNNGLVQNLNDIFVNMITVGIVLVVVAVIYVLGMTISIYRANKTTRNVKLTVPFMSAGILLGSLALVAKVFDR